MNSPIFWGDIHGHTEVSGGSGSLNSYFEFAKDYAALDFASVSDHNPNPESVHIHPQFWRNYVDEQDWELTKAVANNFNEPGKFVSFAGQEGAFGNAVTLRQCIENAGCLTAGWPKDPATGQPDWNQNPTTWECYQKPECADIVCPEVQGDWHVYYNSDNPPLFTPDTVEEFLQQISEWKEVQKASGNQFPVFMMASHGGRLSLMSLLDHPLVQSDPDLVPIVEIIDDYISSPCSFETWAQRGLSKTKLGIMASSDDHTGHPGYSPMKSGQGYIAVYANKLTRDAIFEAIIRRKVYAHSHSDRAILNFSIDTGSTNVFMGSEAVVYGDNKPKINFRIISQTGIKRIDLIKNGKIIATAQPNSRGTVEEVFSYTDNSFQEDSYYYVKALHQNWATSWSSPIWLKPEEGRTFYKAENSPYGMNISTGRAFWTNVPESYYPKLAGIVADSGARWVFIDIRQKEFDPNPPEGWDESVPIEKLDKFCRALLNRGLKIAVSVTLPRGSDFNLFYPNGLRGNWRAWENFLHFVVSRYGANGKNYIHYWSIENESDSWDLFRNDPDLYLELIQHSWPIAKQNDSRAVIISTSWTQLHLDDGEIVDRWLKKGLCDYFDIYSYNTYGSTENVIANLQKSQTLLAKYPSCQGKPIWLKETNTCWREAECPSLKESAAVIADRYQQVIRLGVQKVFWHHVADHPRSGRGILSDPENVDSCLAAWKRYDYFETNDCFDSLQEISMNYTLPSAPNISQPKQGQIMSSLQPTFRWDPAVPGTHDLWKYVIHITSDSDPYFLEPHIYRTESDTRELTVEDLAPGDYLVRVKAVDKYHNHGPWGEPVFFKLRDWEDATSDLTINSNDLKKILSNYHFNLAAPTLGDGNLDNCINGIDFGLWISETYSHKP